MLLSSINGDGSVSNRQHYSCLLVDGRVAIDAGSLAGSIDEVERSAVRDIVLTHAHLDHIAGLPLFIDDLFSVLTEPVRIHASQEVIDILEEHVFNWHVYPRFSELTNQHGKVIEYVVIEPDRKFSIGDLTFDSVNVNHRVPSLGFVVSNANSTFAITGDTAEMAGFWEKVNALEALDCLLIECAFPDDFEELASISHHLTPRGLEKEVKKFQHQECPIYVVNIKPSYRDAVVQQLADLNIARLKVFELGKDHDV